MTIGGVTLEGTVIEFAFFAAIFSLLVAMFLTGRLFGLRRWEEEHNTIGALAKLVQENKERNAELRRERHDIITEGNKAQDSLDRWEKVRQDHAQLKKMRQELDEFEREELSRIDELERRRVERARVLGEIEAALAKYPNEIMSDDNDKWDQLLTERKEEHDELQKNVENAKKEYAELNSHRLRAEEETAAQRDRKIRLEEEISIEEERLELIKTDQLNELKPLAESLVDEITQLKTRIEDAKDELSKEKETLDNTKRELGELDSALAARRNANEAVSEATIEFPGGALAVAIKEMPGASDVGVNGEKLGAFRILPECLDQYDTPRVNTNEDDLLSEFEQTLENSGLRYPPQIVRAFHTALKVSDLSPLAVLSGLSGTGKSQLPRAYASFFGIHFLHVPVEPGWDSPQDLLGFYDFVAKRYRPTDRARALGHFDRRFANDINIELDRDWGDRMLIILLDEMNLARTEYYFSEFLSRLEMRAPRVEDDGDSMIRDEARIGIDLPYSEDEKPKHLYVPHNVLWVGTLNEDETTQALSDKVLDRANSIRFAPPKPETLRKHSSAPSNTIRRSEQYLPYKEWLKWSDRETTRIGLGQVEETLQSLAEWMQAAGRGFGYRVTQSILAYVNCYPGQDWRVPMIDQINMRLLPKLAGTEMSDCQETIDNLKRHCEENLGNPHFANALNKAATASEVSQIFTWPGYTYEEPSN